MGKRSVSPGPVLKAGAAAAAPTWRAAYSDRTAELMAVLSQLAYLPFDDRKRGKADAGTPRGLVRGGRATLQRHLGPDFDLKEIFDRDDTQAYLAVSQDFAVLAFRGTQQGGDWITDFRATRVKLKGAPAAVMVHEGFLSAFECCRDEITAAVDKHVPPTLGLYITGHSLGGGVAQIASAALERDNLAACYTFGSPRVGTIEFDRQVKCPHYRIVHRWDLVPGVPPWRPGGYHHTGDARWLKKGPELLRRNRSILVEAVVTVVSILAALPTGRLFVVDDHMIGGYAADLRKVAGGRKRKTTDPKAPPDPVGALLKAVSGKPTRSSRPKRAKAKTTAPA